MRKRIETDVVNSPEFERLIPVFTNKNLRVIAGIFASRWLDWYSDPDTRMPSPSSERPGSLAAKLDAERQRAERQLAAIDAASAARTARAEAAYAIDPIHESGFSPDVESAFLVLKAQVDRHREESRAQRVMPENAQRSPQRRPQLLEDNTRLKEQLRQLHHMSDEEIVRLVRLVVPEAEKSKIVLPVPLTEQEIRELFRRFSEFFRSRKRRAFLLQQLFAVLGKRSEDRRRTSETETDE